MNSFTAFDAFKKANYLINVKKQERNIHMNEFKNIMERATLQHLSYQMRDSGILLHHDPDSFNVREEKAYNHFNTELERYLNEEQITKVEVIINDYVSKLSEIYFNIGIKTGARLLNQLLNEGDRDY